MKLIVTGFNPFGNVKVNPSQLIVEHVQRTRPDVWTLLLPTEYRRSSEMIRASIRDLSPDAVLMFGVAQTRKAFTLERIAINVDDASIADNVGVLASGQPVEPEGAIAYWSSLPLDAMLAALTAREIPAAISNHAGTFVCNHVFYTALHALEQMQRRIPCGFVHLPGLLPPEGDAQVGMTLQQMIAGADVLIETLLRGNPSNHA